MLPESFRGQPDAGDANELVLNFDDSLFEESVTESRVARLRIDDYQPNIAASLWYLKPSAPHSAQTLKYKADYLYHTGDYKQAFEVYEQCILTVPPTNRTLLRDAVECKVWCLLRMGELDRARRSLQSFTESVLAHATTHEQRTPAVFLSVHLHSVCGNIDQYEKALKEALCIHPLRAVWWHQLANVYRSKMSMGGAADADTSKSACREVPAQPCPTVRDDTIERRCGKHSALTLVCDILTQCIARRNASHATSFARSNFEEERDKATKFLELSKDFRKEEKDSLRKVVESNLDKATICLEASTFDETLLTWISED